MALAQAAPYMASAALSLGQMISGAIKKKQANQMALPEVDPTQAATLAELRQKRQQLEQGTGFEYDALKQQVGQARAQTQQNVLKAGGGDVGATMQGLNMAQQSSDRAFTEGSLPLVQKAGAYQQMANQLVNDIAQRKFEVQQWQKLQKLREAAELTKAGTQNILPAAYGISKNLPTGGKGTGVAGNNAPSAFTEPKGSAPTANDMFNMDMLRQLLVPGYQQQFGQFIR